MEVQLALFLSMCGKASALAPSEQSLLETNNCLLHRTGVEESTVDGKPSVEQMMSAVLLVFDYR